MAFRFYSIENICLSAADMIRPPERLTVSQAAEKYRIIDGLPWSNKTAPYLTEPMDMMGSNDHVGMVFVGPQRTGKSEMFLNWLTYTEKCDPVDMMAVDMTRTVARDWSNTQLKRYFHRTKVVGEHVLKHNVHDVTFDTGNTLLIKWPAITELSGKTIPRLFLRDYDRFPEDVDGEGNAYDLAAKRAESFRRFGMCVAESSPGFEIEDPKWVPTSPHEAPPTRGILELYNRGDRRRWYWTCPNCHEAFQPRFGQLVYPNTVDEMEAAEQVVLKCPHCAFAIEPEFKPELNRAGIWLREGQYLQNGHIVGNGRVSDIASFYMFGPAALYQKWSSLVLNYLRAMQAYETTGDVGPLKKTVTGDQAEAFLSPALSEGRMPNFLADRAEDWGGTKEDPVVPNDVRFLVATVDVQAGSRAAFVVQVHGFAPGKDVYLIDMFKIRKSERRDEHDERIVIDPAGYIEDWQVLIEQVIEKTYPLADGSGRRMQIKLTGCDSGGEAGVTPNAINFWRWLRDKHGAGHHLRFQLIRPHGETKKPRWVVNYIDSSKKDRHSGARGDVPFLMLNSNMMKDQISAMLGRTDPGNGMVHFPYWAPSWLYAQLTSETRTTKGWEKLNTRTRNEAWDLLYYAIGVCLMSTINLEKIDWAKPPFWAAPWDKNSMVFKEGSIVPSLGRPKKSNDLTKLGEEFA